MTSWSELSTSGLSAAEIKQQVDLVAVCARKGIELEFVGGDQYRYEGLCPFHDDQKPSFGVWFHFETRSWRAGCWSCSFKQGDVFDVIQALENKSFREALHHVRELMEDLPEWEPPQRDDVVGPDLTARYDTFEADEELLIEFLAEKALVPPAEWLIAEFGVKTFADGTIVIPHFAADRTCNAMKLRRPGDWTPKAVRGSQLTELYGIWRDQKHSRIILVEGESDAWTLAYALRDENIDVFGLPSGAAAIPRREWITNIGDRDVTLLFDADAAGREAMKTWAENLGICTVATLFEGEDVSSIGADAAMDAVSRGFRYGTVAPSSITRAINGMSRPAANANGGAVALSDTVIELERVIYIGDHEDIIYEVTLDGEGPYRARVSDLATRDAITRWLNLHGKTWFAGSKDCQELVRTLNMEATFVPQLHGVSQVGFVPGSNAFALPDETIGSKGYVYTPPLADTRQRQQLAMDAGPYDPDALLVAAKLHAPSVMTPILGWMAASFFRQDFVEFPILTVTGGAGWGKTTLMQETMRLFGIKRSVVLTASTPHAISSYASATTSIPVWFDEYRAGMREDSKLVLDQIMRDAWDLGASVKGGQTDNKSQLTYFPATAPLCVTGEDAFRETSHMERMANVGIPMYGRDRDMLTLLRQTETGGFARAFVAWAVEARRADVLRRPPRETDRPAQVRAAIAWGYEALNLFSLTTSRATLPPLDLSRVEAAQNETMRENPIVAGLRYFLDRFEGSEIVWTVLGTEDVAVLLPSFVAECRKLDMPLPGNATAVRRWLSERFSGVRDVHDRGRGAYLVIPGARSTIVDG